MLNLKGVICGTALFGFISLAYLLLQARQLNDLAPRPPGTQVGIDIGSISASAVRNPTFWIVLIVCVALCSFLFRGSKGASL